MRTLCFFITVAIGSSVAWSIDAEPAVAELQVVAPEQRPEVQVASELSEGESPEEVGPEQPWDYSPYRVLIWLASDNPRVTAASVDVELREFLDRDFASIWRVDIDDAPVAVRAAAFRNIDAMDYDKLTAADPVLAVKRDHKEAIRIRSAATVAEFVGSIASTQSAMDELVAKGDGASMDRLREKISVVDGDSLAVQNLCGKPAPKPSWYRVGWL